MKRSFEILWVLFEKNHFQFGFLWIASLESKTRRCPILRFIIAKKQCEIISSTNLKGIKYSRLLYLQEKQALRTPLAQDYSNRYNLIDCGREKYLLCVFKKGLWSNSSYRSTASGSNSNSWKQFNELIKTFQTQQN